MSPPFSLIKSIHKMGQCQDSQHLGRLIGSSSTLKLENIPRSGSVGVLGSALEMGSVLAQDHDMIVISSSMRVIYICVCHSTHCGCSEIQKREGEGTSLLEKATTHCSYREIQREHRLYFLIIASRTLRSHISPYTTWLFDKSSNMTPRPILAQVRCARTLPVRRRRANREPRYGVSKAESATGNQALQQRITPQIWTCVASRRKSHYSSGAASTLVFLGGSIVMNLLIFKSS